MERIQRVMLGALAGGALGLAVPVALASIYLMFGGDPQGAGAISFFPLVTLPLGLYAGGVAGSVWEPGLTLTDVFLKVLWKLVTPFRPFG